MLIKTITCHDVYNCGASLQAYALQEYLTQQGHQVEIIDYKPAYLSGHYKLGSIANSKYDRPILRTAYLAAKLPGRLLALRRKRLFDQFTAGYLHLTGKRYTSHESLASDPPYADVYLAGSDQIWNPLFPNGKDPAFFLDFAPSSSIRASYAASFATNEIDEAIQPWLKTQLARLDHISVREPSSLPLLRRLGYPGAQAVCDPVFLLTPEHWNQLLPSLPHTDEPYIFAYDSEQSRDVYALALQAAQQINAHILYLGTPYRRHPLIHNISLSTGPLEFLQRIRDASFVISNSFHATAFAILFDKPFCTINRTSNINIRMGDLLSDTNLKARHTTTWNANLLRHEDVEEAYSSYRTVIKESRAFLSDLLGIQGRN